ncbi:unnamed protein product [Zymoseptoria tritici ST99CH_1E4]|uniref:Apple domain-containing protein n=2 Tax=Zymoseptoria tritici TaxID=1047171 RepID=F9XP87_ZYMTI|nr:uncharacterized protein MYCGRDRAFT_97214 [Zymoseptoria tritici IPO323]EGP83006.1 hypothetical protein MYCGRDRAFT_97214 [Zymoseptoria tritici IPO323]SMR61129.1 unnamed protein product [Zymoseptoria tritici ST99CH_1E4]
MLLLHLGTVLVYALGTLGNSITLDERAAGKCAEKTETRFSARRCVQHCQIVHPSYIFKDLVVRDFDACIESCGKDRKCDVASYSRRTRKCYLKDSRALRSTRRSPLIDTILETNNFVDVCVLLCPDHKSLLFPLAAVHNFTNEIDQLSGEHKDHFAV